MQQADRVGLRVLEPAVGKSTVDDCDRVLEGQVPAEDSFDMVVIGSGPAGEKAAAQAAYFGKRVAVVERSPSPAEQS